MRKQDLFGHVVRYREIIIIIILLYGLNTRYVIHCDSEESQETQWRRCCVDIRLQSSKKAAVFKMAKHSRGLRARQGARRRSAGWGIGRGYSLRQSVMHWDG